MAGIELAGVSKRFADHTAVHDVTLSVADGEFVTLLGPSGCGKTTTLRMIAGFTPPDDGTIAVDGRPLSGPGWAVDPRDRDMGMVFQNYALWPHKNVFHNVAYGLKMQRVAKKEQRRRVDEILGTVGLAGLGSRTPSELSGGQQQRVALARSLVTSPRILLLDEPLSNLDAKLRDRMRAELQDIQRQVGVTFVYVTHDQGEALSMSDRIAVLDEGQVEQFAAPWEIYHRPASASVATFMGLTNFVDGHVADRNAAHVVVDTSCLGRQAVPVSGVFADADVGDRVQIAVRPESVEITAAPGRVGDSDAPVVRGTVLRASLLGSVTLATVDVGGHVIQVQIAGYTELAADMAVAVTVQSEQLNIYGADDPPAAVPQPAETHDVAGVA